MSKFLGCLGITVVVILVGIIITAMVGVGQYNGMVTADEKVNTEWGDIESNLQRRLDLIPNLVEVAKGYAQFEKDTLTAVTKARQQVNQIDLKGVLDNPAAMKQLANAEAQMNSALSRLLVTIEKYPDLKANEQFTNLGFELAGTENRINIARQRYNDSVGDLNKRTRRFPGNIIAGMFGIEGREYFKADEGAKEAPKVDLKIN